MTPRPRREAGFTLIEVLVATVIFIALLVMVMTAVVTISRATANARELTRINQQARVAMERMTRELRQASAILSAVLPATTGGSTSLTLGVDFNGNGVLDDVTADPEVLTYRYDAAADQLTLTANDEEGNSVTRPILASDVTGLTLTFRSSLWQYDTNRDGRTDWTELDAAAGVGNQNGVLDDPELAKIDLVAITLTVSEGSHTQTYQTQVTLRNQAQS